MIAQPDPEQRARLRRLATERLGAPKTGPFWNRWLREYYPSRVPVEIAVGRLIVWPDLLCAGTVRVLGEPLPDNAGIDQTPPKHGTGLRLDVAKCRQRLARLPHTLVGYAGADGRQGQGTYAPHTQAAA